MHIDRTEGENVGAWEYHFEGAGSDTSGRSTIVEIYLDQTYTDSTIHWTIILFDYFRCIVFSTSSLDC